MAQPLTESLHSWYDCTVNGAGRRHNAADTPTPSRASCALVLPLDVRRTEFHDCALGPITRGNAGGEGVGRLPAGGLPTPTPLGRRRRWGYPGGYRFDHDRGMCLGSPQSSSSKSISRTRPDRELRMEALHKRRRRAGTGGSEATSVCECERLFIKRFFGGRAATGGGRPRSLARSVRRGACVGGGGAQRPPPPASVHSSFSKLLPMGSPKMKNERNPCSEGVRQKGPSSLRYL